MSDKRTVVITGATGLVGSHLCCSFRRNAWRVKGLVRRAESFPFDSNGISFSECVLPDRIDSDVFKGADVVIHAAYTTVATSHKEAKRVNEDGTQRVLEMCRASGVPKFVFISSLSSHSQARSYYGRSKYVLEQSMDVARDLVIRPGLVLAEDGGLFGRMRDQIARSSVVPVFDGGTQIVQTIHVEDLCTAIYKAVEMDVNGVVPVAEPDGLQFREFAQEIAARLGKSLRIMSVPHRPVVAVLRGAEAVGLRFPISSENVLGLVALKHAETAGFLEALGLTVRTACQSLDEFLCHSVEH